MITFIIILIIYLSIGFGFALAAWLEAAEMEVNKKKDIPKFLSKTLIIFVLMWPFIALYCWRAKVKKTIPPMEIMTEMLKNKGK